MRVDTTYHFDRITWRGVRKGKCQYCRKAMRQQRTFESYNNPFNKHKDGPRKGQIKTAGEIQDEVMAKAEAWSKEPFTLAHDKCIELAP